MTRKTIQSGVKISNERDLFAGKAIRWTGLKVAVAVFGGAAGGMRNTNKIRFIGGKKKGRSAAGYWAMVKIALVVPGYRIHCCSL